MAPAKYAALLAMLVYLLYRGLYGVRGSLEVRVSGRALLAATLVLLLCGWAGLVGLLLPGWPGVFLSMLSTASLLVLSLALLGLLVVVVLGVEDPYLGAGLAHLYSTGLSLLVALSCFLVEAVAGVPGLPMFLSLLSVVCVYLAWRARERGLRVSVPLDLVLVVAAVSVSVLLFVYPGLGVVFFGEDVQRDVLLSSLARVAGGWVGGYTLFQPYRVLLSYCVYSLAAVPAGILVLYLLIPVQFASFYSSLRLGVGRSDASLVAFTLFFSGLCYAYLFEWILGVRLHAPMLGAPHVPPSFPYFTTRFKFYLTSLSSLLCLVGLWARGLVFERRLLPLLFLLSLSASCHIYLSILLALVALLVLASSLSGRLARLSRVLGRGPSLGFGECALLAAVVLSPLALSLLVVRVASLDAPLSSLVLLLKKASLPAVLGAHGLLVLVLAAVSTVASCLLPLVLPVSGSPLPLRLAYMVFLVGYSVWFTLSWHGVASHLSWRLLWSAPQPPLLLLLPLSPPLLLLCFLRCRGLPVRLLFGYVLLFSAVVLVDFSSGTLELLHRSLLLLVLAVSVAIGWAAVECRGFWALACLLLLVSSFVEGWLVVGAKESLVSSMVPSFHGGLDLYYTVYEAAEKAGGVVPVVSHSLMVPGVRVAPHLIGLGRGLSQYDHLKLLGDRAVVVLVGVRGSLLDFLSEMGSCKPLAYGVTLCWLHHTSEMASTCVVEEYGGKGGLYRFYTSLYNLLSRGIRVTLVAPWDKTATSWCKTVVLPGSLPTAHGSWARGFWGSGLPAISRIVVAKRVCIHLPKGGSLTLESPMGVVRVQGPGKVCLAPTRYTYYFQYQATSGLASSRGVAHAPLRVVVAGGVLVFEDARFPADIGLLVERGRMDRLELYTVRARLSLHYNILPSGGGLLVAQVEELDAVAAVTPKLLAYRQLLEAIAPVHLVLAVVDAVVAGCLAHWWWRRSG